MAKAATTQLTKDHDVIRRWAEARNGKPVMVKGEDIEIDEASQIGIVFPDYGNQGPFQETSWDEFLRVFDENNLVFAYEESAAEGTLSRFYRIIRHETAEVEEASELKPGNAVEGGG